MVTEFPPGVELALKFIREERCCPPIEILSADPSSEHARRHLESCDLCSQKIGLGHDGGGFVRIFSESKNSSVPAPGQVWTMRPERGGWGPGVRWYGTPDVLVLRTIGETGVRVAQVCELEELQCNEDVPLGEGFEGFAEPWNTFPLLVDDLDVCLGEVAADVVETVLTGEQIAGRDALPLFMADFRRMEMDTSVYHARRAAFILVEGVEADGEDTENPISLVLPQEQSKSVIPFPRATHVFQFAKDIYEYAPAAGSNWLDFGPEYSRVHARLNRDDGRCTLENQEQWGAILVFYAEGKQGKSLIPQRKNGETFVVLPAGSQIELQLALPEDGYTRISLDVFRADAL